MSKAPSIAPVGGLGVQDVLFVLFKHKWKILSLSMLGLGAAAMVSYMQEPIYKSSSKLLVRYVMEKGTVDPYVAMTSPGGGGKSGDPVINTEIEILLSQDLALDVVDTVGIKRLLPDPQQYDESQLRSFASGLILSKLEVTPGQSSTVLHVSYTNKDRQLAKDVLTHLVDRYFKKHLEIHRSAAAFDVVANQMADARVHLQETEAKLNQLRTETGVMTLQDATGALSSQRIKTQEDLLKARADLAEKMAIVESLRKDDDENDPITRESRGTGLAGTAIDQARDSHPNPDAPLPKVISDYRAIMELLEFLKKRELDLRIKFKEGNRLLVLNQQQINQNDLRRLSLERTYPGLISVVEKLSPDTANPRTKLILERASIAALQAKIDVLVANLKEIGEQFSCEYTVGAKIEELRRQRDIEDTEYRVLETNLKNARIDQTLDPSRMPNITIVQKPSDPVKSFDAKTKKMIYGLAGGGLGLGIALALAIELVFSHKVSRPIEIQTRLQLPLLLTIPYISKKERGAILLDLPHTKTRITNTDKLSVIPSDTHDRINESVMHRSSSFILPYAEAIRDRMIFNFEVNNVTHKPKLVAVTGLSAGAGTSTIAAGLAKAFTEIRGIKVLLVDMSGRHQNEDTLVGDNGILSISSALDLARLTTFRESSQNIYYANASARRDNLGLSSFTPIHLHELMPHLQSCDYDYIIFDMPQVNQTSCTITMAGMMDKVLLVLDAENTARDDLVWGYGELIKSKADVSCVFNKNQTHTPSWVIGRN